MYHKPQYQRRPELKPEATHKYEFKPEGLSKPHQSKSRREKPTPESNLEKQGE